MKTNLVFMKRFCYRCGALEAQQGPLIKGLCQRCFAAENRLLQTPAELEVKVCGRCGAHLLGKRWHEAGEGDAIANAIRATVLSNLKVARLSDAGMNFFHPREVPELELWVEPKLAERVINVRVKGKVHELQVKPQFDEACIKFMLKRSTCDVCGLKSAHHYEAILQVRGKLTKEKSSKVKKILQRLAMNASKRERNAFIANVKERREGFDLYVNPVSLAKQMASMLKLEFGAEIKESSKLIGQTRNGRRKFRFSILVRLPSERN
jgi:nonsense-mediated mRNA decay protein 3